MFSNLQFWVLILGLGFFCTDATIAQNRTQQELSLSEAIERTTSGNHQIKVAAYELQAAQSDVDKVKSFYLPQVQASLAGALTNLPLNAFGSKLQQGAIQQSDFIPNALNSPSIISNIQSQLMVRQPIINQEVKAMQEALISKSKAYKEQAQRTESTLRFQVQQTYLQLQLAYEVKKVLLNAKKTASANLKLVEDNVDVGYLQKADLLSVTLHINQIENQLFEAESNIQNASDQLSFLMGVELNTQFIPTDQLTDDGESPFLSESLSLNRSDIKAMHFQLEAQEYMLQSIQKSKLPSIQAIGAYELNNPMNFSDAQHGFMLMVQASWKIFDGNSSKNAAQKATIELLKHQTNLDQMIAQNRLELERSKRTILEARNKINLAKEAIEQSKEFLRIKTNRFEEGLEKTTDLLMAETEVAQKEMGLVEALYQHKIASQQLLFLLEKE